ncbi:MAG: hypothetical protein AMS25_09650 [Gemmatimonas sp. SM23_52]|nr:MAG: hypothetical protein AMS25_09650 [Gemmatimonas sp. SM23_52]
MSAPRHPEDPLLNVDHALCLAVIMAEPIRLLNVGHYDEFRIQLARDLRDGHRSLHLIADMIGMIGT